MSGGKPVTQTESPPLIELDGAAKTYTMGKVAVPALKPTDLTINAGELIVMLGPSGSGKTTVLNLIGGIDRPTAGRVLFRGKDLSRMNEDEITEYRRTSVGFIFQFFNLIPTLTALENVEFVAELVEHPADPMEVLDEVGLAERANHFPSELSGGEQQRVAIARALANNPDVILADEPTGNLDSKTGKMVITFLKKLNKEEKKTIVMVTHDISLAKFADRVEHLQDGLIVKS